MMGKIKTVVDLIASRQDDSRIIIPKGTILEVFNEHEVRPFCYELQCKDLDGCEYTIRNVSKKMILILEEDDDISIWDGIY